MKLNIFYSSPSGARWSPPIRSKADMPVSTVTLLPHHRFQQILGFGGAFTESSAYVFSQLSPQTQQQFIDACFDPKTGLGYTLGRVSIHSNDFSLCSYIYTDFNDLSLESFSLAHEQIWLLPMLRQAKARCNTLQLLASVWSPPAWMKTNGSMSHGGSLLPECQSTWARYLHRYLTEMARQGFPIDYLSVQNEPEATQTWESCLYTSRQEADFIAEHLGPLLKKKHPSVRLLGWDHNRDHLTQRADALLHSAAAEYIWGLGYHWYVSEDHEALARTHLRHPGIHLLFTEGCLEGGPRPDDDWQPAVRYAENYMQDLNNWCEGFWDWNLLLDMDGGPNHVGNYCHSPILADTASRQIYKNSAYYAIGHFSRVLRPGAVRIAVQPGGPLLATAAQNLDGSLACIIYNPTCQPQAVQAVLDSANPFCSFYMEAKSIASLTVFK